MDFSERLSRVEGELLRMNANQFYTLRQGRIYTFQSNIVRAKPLDGGRFWTASMSYKFIPVSKDTPIMYPILHIYNTSGVEVSLENVYRTIMPASTALCQYELDNDWLILNNPRYALTTFISSPDLSDPSLKPFSMSIQVVSSSDGAFSWQEV